MTDSKFQDYVTSTAFSLTLSRPMIEALSDIHQSGGAWIAGGTFNSLLGRGLIEVDTDHFLTKGLSAEVMAQIKPIAKLTEAGQAVIPLLKLAGLYIYDPRREAIKDFYDNLKAKS